MSALSVMLVRSYSAKTLRVRTVSRIEALVDLGFDMSIRRTFVLRGVTLPPQIDTEQAKHCLIILIGAKRLIVRPDVQSCERWGVMEEIPCRIFLAERVFGKPIGYTINLPEAAGPVLELGPYISWLATQNFDLNVVKQTVNGAP